MSILLTSSLLLDPYLHLLISVFVFLNQPLLRFGVKNQDLPHPEADWLAFSAAISLLNDKEPLVWNSIAKKPTKWINMSRLTHTYGRNKQGGKQGNSGGKDIGDACCTVA